MTKLTRSSSCRTDDQCSTGKCAGGACCDPDDTCNCDSHCPGETWKEVCGLLHTLQRSAVCIESGGSCTVIYGECS